MPPRLLKFARPDLSDKRRGLVFEPCGAPTFRDQWRQREAWRGRLKEHGTGRRGHVKEHPRTQERSWNSICVEGMLRISSVSAECHCHEYGIDLLPTSN